MLFLKTEVEAWNNRRKMNPKIVEIFVLDKLNDV